MRIISKYSDYYDGYMNFNRKDPFNKVWVRSEEKIKVNKNELSLFEERKVNLYIYWRDRGTYAGKTIFFVVAGKIYPAVKVLVDGNWDYYDNYEPDHYEYIFDLETIKQEYPLLLRNNWNDTETRLNEFFNGFYPDVSELCLSVGSPILMIQPNIDYYEERYSSFRTIHKDINLKDYSFSKMFTAPQIYQELDYFISNIMVNDDMPDSPQSDIDKVHSHGFDGWSFRKKGKRR